MIVNIKLINIRAVCSTSVDAETPRMNHWPSAGHRHSSDETEAWKCSASKETRTQAVSDHMIRH